MAYDKPLPEPTPETQEFWDGLKRHELRIQRCLDCDRFYFYPRPFCPHPGCRSGNVQWETVSGLAKLHTYVISHRGFGGFAEETPFVIAVVEVEPTPEALPVDMPLEIVFDDVTDEVTLAKFRPARG